MKKVFPLVILVSVIFFTCKKDKKNEPGTPPISTSGKISGKIALPEGTPVDINSLSVVSLIQTSDVKNETYELDSIAVPNYSTRFVLDADSNVVLMHYNYPGEKNDISSRTTALAMFMNAQSVSSLSESAKGSLISKITSQSSFNKLIEEIENSIKSGKGCFDTTNNELQKAFTDLFTTASSLKITDQYSKPISIYRQGRQITLVNNGVSCSYVAGVYKDDTKVGEFIKFDGVEFAPASLYDLLTGNYEVPELEEKKLQLEGDGRFEIKIRSGRINDGTPESNTALLENRKQYVIKVISSWLLPFIKGDSPCFKAIIIKLTDFLIQLPITTPPDNFNLLQAGKQFHEIVASALSFSLETIKGCVGVDAEKSSSKFVKGLTQYLKYWDWVSKIGNTINITARVVDFVNASPKIDTCFIALGNDVASCSEMPQLKTDEAQYITESTAMIPVRIISDGGSEIQDKGICYGTSPNPKLGGGAVSAGSGPDDFTSTLTDLEKNKKYYARAYAVIEKNGMVVYGNEVSFATKNDQDSDSTFTDPRDGQVYTYKRIGTQVWMIQNLNYAAVGSWCYDNNGANCAVYGRLYDWNTALTVAPPGWHLPSDAEWQTLVDYLGGDNVAGGKMKEAGTAHWQSPNTGADNSSGFAGLPGGFSDSGTFYYIGRNGVWWSSTEHDTTAAGACGLLNNFAYVLEGGTAKAYGLSVRCVRD